jgi:5-methyltetrahydrofolate--homocysteine methyltransferase
MPDARTRLEAILAERIAVLDGSWGVLIQREVKGEEAYRGERFENHPRDVAGDPDLLNLTRPELVADIHRQYFAAGADIATTNTFTATSIGQADYGLEGAVYEMNVAGARLAREAADTVGGFVAGSVGPLNVTLSLSPRVDDPAFRTHTFAEVRDAYAEQIRALAEGGVHFLLIETIFDTLNAKAAIAAALDEAPQLPLWISFTAIDRSSRRRCSRDRPARTRPGSGSCPPVARRACRTRSAARRSDGTTRTWARCATDPPRTDASGSRRASS